MKRSVIRRAFIEEETVLWLSKKGRPAPILDK